jgi:coenzyme F420-reducing hydrogenase gamma subunit
MSRSSSNYAQGAKSQEDDMISSSSSTCVVGMVPADVPLPLGCPPHEKPVLYFNLSSLLYSRSNNHDDVASTEDDMISSSSSTCVVGMVPADVPLPLGCPPHEKPVLYFNLSSLLYSRSNNHDDVASTEDDM